MSDIKVTRNSGLCGGEQARDSNGGDGRRIVKA